MCLWGHTSLKVSSAITGIVVVLCFLQPPPSFDPHVPPPGLPPPGMTVMAPPQQFEYSHGIGGWALC